MFHYKLQKIFSNENIQNDNNKICLLPTIHNHTQNTLYITHKILKTQK